MKSEILTCKKIYSNIPFAHRQHRHSGHCRLIHGHNWTFEFTFVASSKDDAGFIVDFGGLKWLKSYIDSTFDHACVLCDDDPLLEELKQLNIRHSDELFKLTELPSVSVEGIAEYLHANIGRRVKDSTQNRVTVLEVTVSEDAKNSATFRSFCE